MPKLILLVDDNPLDIELTCLALASQGLDQGVTVARDGKAALKVLEEATPEALPKLMLLDLHMPEMDGFSLLRHLRARPQWDGVRVVVLTTSDDLQDREASAPEPLTSGSAQDSGDGKGESEPQVG